jgi:hypothetical protein
LIYIKIFNGDVTDWAQYDTRIHKVVGIGAPGSDLVIDPSWRLDSLNRLNDINPNFVFNERNQIEFSQFRVEFFKKFPNSPIPPFLETYRSTVANQPISEAQVIMNTSQYFNDYWYLNDAPNLRRTHGYNDSDTFKMTDEGTAVQL